MKKTSEYKLPTGKVLVLRSCKNDLTSYEGFKWPEIGYVKAPDWKENKECGNGLHGWLWATGDFSLKYKDHNAKWLAVEVEEKDIVQLNGKVKFPEGNVILCGTFRQAFELVMKWFWLAVGKEAESKATGYCGHASATGDSGHASATGYCGHASATGRYGHASATGNSGHASATGYCGHASATGDSGHASTTGDYGHASATGYYGHAVVLGLNGKAKCGENGAIILTYWDGKRLRHKIGYAGEDGVEHGKTYELDIDNNFIETAE